MGSLMQVMETSADGLKRTLSVVVGAGELTQRFSERLLEIKDKAQLKGFRKGKVPVSHLKKLYGRALMAEVIDAAVKETSKKAIDERKERPALSPSIALPEDKDEIERVIKGEADLTYSMSFEVLPPIPLPDFAALELERLVADVEDPAIDEAIGALVERGVTFEPEEGRAGETGDRLVVDYTGQIEGEPFDGGTDEGAHIVLGKGSFLPGFEDGLLGAKAGETRTVRAAFPAEYPAAQLAGKEASFEVTVKDVAKPVRPAIDDAFAESLGVENLAKLRELVSSRLAQEYEAASRAKLKRELLDCLDKSAGFQLPASLVESEFELIWRQLTQGLERAGKTFADEGKTEEELREEYRKITERRVRLGLVIGDIGEKNGVEVTQEELRRALVAQARRYPGQERLIYEYYEKTPGALVELRGPIFEDKVVDLVLERAKPIEVRVSKDELLRRVEEATEA